MRPVLIAIARHLVVLAFALALSILIGQFPSIKYDGDPGFLERSIALAVICLISLHWRWLLGLKRTTT